MFGQNIPYDYLLMACTRIALEIHWREIIPKVMKGEQLFLNKAHCLNLIHIVINFHLDILFGCLLMVCTRQALESNQRQVMLRTSLEAIILIGVIPY